jgi:hypothetical protein
MSSRHERSPSSPQPSSIANSSVPVSPQKPRARPPHSRNNSSRSALRSAEEQLQDIRDGDTSWQRSHSPSVVDSSSLDGLSPGAENAEANNNNNAKKEPTVRVYLHHVRKTDTLPLLLLAYETSATVLKKSNRLWSTDSIQSRKELYLPMEECGIKAQPCQPPQDPKSKTSAARSLDNKHYHTNIENGEWPVRLDRVSELPDEQQIESDTTEEWVLVPGIGPVQLISIPSHKLSYFPSTQRRNTMERSTSLPTLETLVAEQNAARESMDSVVSRSSIGSLVEDGLGRVVRLWHDNQGRKKWSKIGKDLIEL